MNRIPSCRCSSGRCDRCVCVRRGQCNISCMCNPTLCRNRFVAHQQHQEEHQEVPIVNPINQVPPAAEIGANNLAQSLMPLATIANALVDFLDHPPPPVVFIKCQGHINLDAKCGRGGQQVGGRTHTCFKDEVSLTKSNPQVIDLTDSDLESEEINLIVPKDVVFKSESNEKSD